jgi:hypothetical protein
MIGKRTKLDFKNHKLKTVKFEFGVIYELAVPDKFCHSCKFINMFGKMFVTGDFGNYVFCREFHPDPESQEGVSESYWLEKLKMHSIQDPYEFDAEETIKEIDLLLTEGVDGNDEDWTEEEKDYLENCRDAAENDPVFYDSVAYRGNVGYFSDYDRLPRVMKLKSDVACVFDAFDEICRLNKEEHKIENN